MMDLISLIQNGNLQARREFVEQTSALVYSAVYRVLEKRRLPDPALDADDFAQEAYLHLLKDNARLLGKYDSSKSAFSTWLTVVVHRKVIDILRKKKVLNLAPDQLPTSQTDPEPVETELEFPKGLLTKRQCLVLRLLFEKEMNAEEISTLLGVEHQTVRSIKFKAIQKLREHGLK